MTSGTELWQWKPRFGGVRSSDTSRACPPCPYSHWETVPSDKPNSSRPSHGDSVRYLLILSSRFAMRDLEFLGSTMRICCAKSYTEFHTTWRSARPLVVYNILYDNVTLNTYSRLFVPCVSGRSSSCRVRDAFMHSEAMLAGTSARNVITI